MGKRVFISRHLSEKSDFKLTLEQEGIEVIGVSMVHFEPTFVSDLPFGDWLFFSSGQAVKFFFSSTTLQNFSGKIGVMGTGTLKILREFDKNADFIGNGAPENVAKDFLVMALGKKVVFPIASNSKRTIQQMLKGQIQAIDLEIYHNEPKGVKLVPNIDILVFTSPLNVQGYLMENEITTGHHLVAIGNSTAGEIRKYSNAKIMVAKEPTEAALAELVLFLSRS